MKKLILISILMLIVSCSTQKYYIKTSVSPESNIKVAIINENIDSWWVSSISYRVLITELMDAGFKVIERTNLENIIKEQKLTSSGLSNSENENDETSKNYISSILDKNSIKEIGNMLGVDKLIITYVVPNRDRKIGICTIRLVEVFSGEILTSTTVFAPMEGSNIDVIMKQVANDMMEAYKTGKRIIRNELELNEGGLEDNDFKENIFRKKVDSN